MEESQALCTKPKEVEALCKESAGAKRANATEEAKGTKEGKGAKEAKDVSSYSPHELGKRGEEAATCFLQRREYEILDRNWKCIAGEADIVALQDDTLCFIEVKTRKDAQKGFPSEAVDMRKRSQLAILKITIMPMYACVSMSSRSLCSERVALSCAII